MWPTDQDMNISYFPEGTLADTCCLSSSPTGNCCSNTWHVDEFCLFLSFKYMESCSIDHLCARLFSCIMLYLRVTDAVCSRSFCLCVYITLFIHSAVDSLHCVVMNSASMNILAPILLGVCIYWAPFSGSHPGESLTLTCFPLAYVCPVFMTIVSLIQTPCTPTQLAVSMSWAKGARRGLDPAGSKWPIHTQ